MKWLAALLFTTLTLLGILKDLSVFISFKSNQEYIVMTMCNGADELINTCNGSCYLTKQLKMIHHHDEESESQIPPNLKNTITYFSEESPSKVTPEYSLVSFNNTIYSNSRVLKGHPQSIDQPPKYY